MFGDSVAEVVRGGEFKANRSMNQKAEVGGEQTGGGGLAEQECRHAEDA